MPGEIESGDQWASIGRDRSRDHKVNPIKPEFGSHAFGTETGGDAGRIVTAHSTLMSDNGEQAGYLDKRTESLRNTAWVIKRVAEYWESGMNVRTVNPTTHPTVFAEGGPVARAVFDTHAADQSYSIGATAPCSPGDSVALNKEDQAERDQGKVLPGDEGLVIQEEPSQ